MPLKDGWLEGAKIVPSPHYGYCPENEQPSLLSFIIVVCRQGNCVDRGLMRGLPGRWIPRRILFSLILFACVFLRIALFVVREKLYSMCLSTGVPGMLAFSVIRNARVSIGIELEGTDVTPYTDAQYDQLARLRRILAERYSGIVHHMAGHSGIASGRKTDPAFDWERFRWLVAISQD